MKYFSLVAVIALAVSVSAASQNQQSNRNNNVFNGNRGGFGNFNNGFFGGQQFGGNNGRNGQNNKNQNNNNKFGNNGNNKNLSSNNGKGANTGNNGKNNAGAASSAAAATSTAAAANTAAAASTAAAAANTAAAASSSDPQSSTTLDPKVIATGFENDGQDVPTAGQVASLTSSNNFINFCLTVPNLPITNGKQITTGSCNPAPMGVIPSTDNMPSAKFQIPKNGDSFTENSPFTITMAVRNFQTGAFVNAEENYFAAPQQVNSGGQIIGHSHVVVEQLDALDQTTPTDPKKFVFFKGLNAPADANGLLTADVTSGLPAGFYRLASINTAANHQPVLVPIAQHGSLDDAVYFTVTAGNASAAQASAAAAGVASSAAPAATAASAKSAVAAPGAKVVAPAKVANPKAAANNKGNQQQQKKGKRSHPRAFL
ncbi:Pathogenicity cluster 5 protein d [Psilocybe cubensis]|uniref:Ribosomal protein s17 n=2 Tax=Psilocybe cubensis TaxID=181762 RepID=A0A8H8CQI5_PSICU|nr:Pathogenicity cluster 5 protein d [Psilocybe cubensis]KAH9486652.1 Pathogenicity cluster 5 protein d [Psilocybe cubensis]